jgi:hypothetical protein
MKSEREDAKARRREEENTTTKFNLPLPGNQRPRILLFSSRLRAFASSRSPFVPSIPNTPLAPQKIFIDLQTYS